MKEFVVQGTITLEGVRFYVKAETLEGALAHLALGGYDVYDDSEAQSVDHHFALSSIEENV